MRFQKMQPRGWQAIFTFSMCVVLLLPGGRRAVAQGGKQALFERVFGEAAKLDPAMVAKVKALPPGKRLLVDRDKDGKNDEVWYLDAAKRHTIHPILVRVIDEDSDLDRNHGPDRDSDLYVADWGADGTVDVVIDYQDNDADGDVDEMGIYSFKKGTGAAKKGILECWWGYDNGDDNLLWYDVNWNYYQRLCQYRCHFSGDETFVSFRLTADGDHWISRWENPFVFYDPDGDGCSEVVARFTGTGGQVDTLRYSFDADADAHGRRVHDYDFSITTLAKKRAGRSVLRLDREQCFATKLRGIPTTGVLRWNAAQAFGRQAAWDAACLTWDEMNANTDADVAGDPNERWEGVLNHESKHFPRVGGPACSTLNKRNEIMRPASPLQLYHDRTDRRLHLLGAGPAEGWCEVDYNLDGKADAKYTYLDDDQDGIFDRRQIDLDADGRPEFDWKMQGKDVRRLTLEYESLSTSYRRMLADSLSESQKFIDTAKAVLGDRLGGSDPVEAFFLNELPRWQLSTGLGQHMRSSPAGARFYMDLLRDRLLYALKKQFGSNPAWNRIEAAYAAGNYGTATDLVARELGSEVQAVPSARFGFGAFTHRAAICIDNQGGPRRDDWPVVLRVEGIASRVPDFNAENCAVVGPDRWMDWLEVPHQVDTIDETAGRELSFLADLPADARTTWYVYYTPRGKRDALFPLKTGAGRDWNSGKLNIGWESAFGAYRFYDGHVDFFGKHAYNHNQRVEWMIYPFKNSGKYHWEQAWGLDALHVGETPGLGGLALVLGDRVYPVWNPSGKKTIQFSKRILTTGPVRTAVEVTARNVVPETPELVVRMLFVIYAEHQESDVRATVLGGPPSILLSPGLVKLTREDTFVDKSLGCLGSWGWQEDGIGEVGLGVIVPPVQLKDVADLPDYRQLRCAGINGTLRYWIIGDWRRGRRFPVSPTIANWRQEMQALSGCLNRETPVTVEAGEEMPESVSPLRP